MTKTILDIMGTVFIVVGIAGFVAPNLGGTHLSPAHNIIHLISGGLALWFGLKGTLSGARKFSWAFAAVYGLLGVVGLAFGQAGVSVMHEMADSKLLTVIPGVLELGRNDHILHIVLALVFAVAAMLARPVTRTTTTQTQPAPNR